MINPVIFDNQIKIWWEYNKLYDGYEYNVYFNGEKVSTKASHYCFKNLKAETEYIFKVDLVDKNGELVKAIGEGTYKTLKTKNVIDVTKSPYNAIGDGKTMNTKNIQKALDDCTENDMVYFPDGEYLTGALWLHSNTEIRLSDRATIQGSFDEKDYLPKIKSRFEGWHEECYQSLLNTGDLDPKGSFNCENITIYGGKIIGGGDNLRKKQIAAEREECLKKYGYENDPNPPAMYYSFIPGRRRGRLFQFSNTKNILIADCFFGNAASWTCHPIYCDNFTACNCTVFSHGISNGDGINPDSTTNSIIFGIHFDTGDDFVAIKSGRNKEGYDVGRPTKNVKIFDCTSSDGHGIAVGSEMSGGVEDVTVWNCDFIKCSVGVSLKTNRCRGGYMKNIKFYNYVCPMISLHAYPGNRDGEPAPYPPVLENFHFEDMTLGGIGHVTGTGRFTNASAINISCTEGYVIKNVTLKNIKLLFRAVLPYQTIFADGVENLVIENIESIGEVREIDPF